MKRYSSFKRRLEKLEAELGKGRFKEEERRRLRFEELFYRAYAEDLTPAEQKEFDSIGPRFQQWYPIPGMLKSQKERKEKEAKQKALLEQRRQEELAERRAKRGTGRAKGRSRAKGDARERRGRAETRHQAEH